MNFQDILKFSGKTGGVATYFAMAMFIYFHLRGYSDSAAWEAACAAVVVAGICNVLPSAAFPKVNGNGTSTTNVPINKTP